MTLLKTNSSQNTRRVKFSHVVSSYKTSQKGMSNVFEVTVHQWHFLMMIKDSQPKITEKNHQIY